MLAKKREARTSQCSPFHKNSQTSSKNRLNFLRTLEIKQKLAQHREYLGKKNG